MKVAAAAAALFLLPAAALACPGDCNGDGAVTVNELVTGVGIALGNNPLDACRAVDRNGSGDVSVDELVAAVASALAGCPAATPTASSSATPTSSPTPTVNLLPEIAPLGVYFTYPELPIALPLPASDPEGAALSFSSTALPEGAEIGAASGIFEWTPGPAQTGPFYVPFTATDAGGLSASSQLPIQVNPPDSCVEATCDPASGCERPLKPLGQNCCVAIDPPPVAQAVADCPQGRVLFVGRNYPRGGFGRIANCNLIRLREGIQTGPVVVLNFETRCLNPFNVSLDVKLETADALVFNEFHAPLNFTIREDRYAELRGEPFAVNRNLPHDQLEGREADLTVTVTDQENVSVSTKVRVVLTFNPVPDLPDL